MRTDRTHAAHMIVYVENGTFSETVCPWRNVVAVVARGFIMTLSARDRMHKSFAYLHLVECVLCSVPRLAFAYRSEMNKYLGHIL